MTKPQRIRIIRGVKGWKAGGARYCTHRTQFGNPFYDPHNGKADRAAAINQYRRWLDGEGPDTITLNDWPYRRPTAADIETLRGRNLACYCPLDGPCHADILLALANR